MKFRNDCYRLSGTLPFGSDSEPNTLMKRIQEADYEFSPGDGWLKKSAEGMILDVHATYSINGPAHGSYITLYAQISSERPY
jgi:hypothetical protein